MPPAAIRGFCGLPFRVLEGVAAASVGGDDAPGYGQVQGRTSRIRVSIRDDIITARGRSVTMNPAMDGPGPGARSEYIGHRHKAGHGFVRMVLVVDTDDTVGEFPRFEPLACRALENAGAAGRAGDCAQGAQGAQCVTGPGPRPPAGSELPDRLKVVMRADGGFDSRETFGPCRRLGITPHARMDHNATARSRGVNRDRGLAALDRLGGGTTDPAEFARLTRDGREASRREWKKGVRYGERRPSEIVISSFKRLFGDAVAARRWDNIAQEISPKVNIYNNMLRVQREAMAMA